MRGLAVDDRGYVVPWFVSWIDGKPEFRAMDGEKWRRAVKDKLCWVCGQKLGQFMTFVVGPMCGVNQVSSEPPSHKECAQWSARNCPFLSRPQMVRREDEEINNETLKESAAGCAVERNPGVALLWTTKDYFVFDDGKGKYLIRMGEPVNVEWWHLAKLATREEVEQAVLSGLPILKEAAEKDGEDALVHLERGLAHLSTLYPVGAMTATEACERARESRERAGS
jgi:hypothetical protein